MNKLLTLSVLSASMVIGGCSTTEKITSAISNPFDGSGLVYRPTIQQGNVLTEAALEELSPGMSKDEVRFSLGTPSLVDVFHQERWDYIYALDVPGEEPVLKTLSLYFENDIVDRVEGEYEADASSAEEQKRVIVTVPDYQGEGFFKRTLGKVGLSDKE